MVVGHRDGALPPFKGTVCSLLYEASRGLRNTPNKLIGVTTVRTSMYVLYDTRSEQ